MFRILFFLIITTVTAFSEPTAAARLLQLNLCCLRYAGDQRSVYVKNAKDATPIELPFYQGGFTEPTAVLSENEHIVFYQKGAEGQAAWVVDWSIPVPKDRNEVSVILLPKETSAQNPAPYQAYVLPTAQEFPYGSVWLVNLTPLPIKMDLGKNSLSLNPGSAKKADLQPHVDSYDMVPVTAWIRNDQQ